MRTYLGTRFEIWTGQQSWFWRFCDPNRQSGSIGAAATETDAVREACRAIEEYAGDSFGDCRSLESALIGWEFSFQALEHYLSQVSCREGSSMG